MHNYILFDELKKGKKKKKIVIVTWEKVWIPFQV